MTTLKIIGGILLAVIVCMAINLAGLGIGFAWLPFYKFGAQLNNTQKTIDIVYDAQRCINVEQSYETLKANIPALRDQQIPNAEAALAKYEAKLPTDQTKWSTQQQQIDGELQTDVTGLNQQQHTDLLFC